MARTALEVTAIAINGAVDTAATGVYQAADATDGLEIVFGEPERILLHVKNAGVADAEVTIKAGTYARSGLGAYAVTVPASGESLIGPFESARFEQPGDALHIDFDVDTSVTVAAFKLP